MSKILEEESDVRIAEKKWREQGNVGLNLDDDGDFLKAANAPLEESEPIENAKSESELFWDNIEKRQANDEKSQTPEELGIGLFSQIQRDGRGSRRSESAPAVRPSQSVRAKSSAAPVGVITLAFTDIQNSTKLWEHFGEVRMKALLDIHNKIMRKCLLRHRGCK
jgi:hypothetical protein